MAHQAATPAAQAAAAPAPAPAPQAAPAPLTNGLRGTPPVLFNGDRLKSSTFLREFDIFWNMNENNEMFTSPYLRVNLALSMVRGPIVDDWVQQQVDELRRKVAAGGGYLRTNEALWTEFRTAFTNAFTNTTEKQRSVTALHNLRMKGDDLDSYIAQFQGLARKAGYPLDQAGTKDLFARGLKRPLLTAILTKRAQVPDTFQEWIDAATDEEKKYATLVSYTSPAPWTRWNPPAKNARPTSSSSSNQQAIPMDIDVIRKTINQTDEEEDEDEKIRKATTAEEKAEHRKSRKCYECSEVGHMAKNCPHKKFKKITTSKADPLNEYLRIIHPLAEEEEEDELPTFEEDSTNYEPDDIETIAARTAAFSPAEREAWVQAMQDLGVDFQQA
jgi:hypothetical protein